MCGIAGIINSDFNKKDMLCNMLKALDHRGPDAQLVWNDDNIVLGHNRLAIIDLNEASNQPMVSTCNRYVIVFNGEIYNYIELKKLLPDYQFKTQSDTEVLLALFIEKGENCLDLINGMFSFAIWDIKDRILFAARDRFGVKPFYYTIHENSFYFASEPKALFNAGIPKIHSQEVWAKYFMSGSYGLPNETFFENIKQLPASHCLTIGNKSNSLKIKKYYNFIERIKQNTFYKNNKFEEEYIDLMHSSISFRLRADVPIGINVSGGLDSSSLLILSNKLNKKTAENFHAFTFYSDNPDYDELPWVEEIVKKTKNKLSSVLITPNETPELALKVANYMEEPYGGLPTLAYSKIFKQARENNIIVLLDGQGIDEAWAGYDYYKNLDMNSIIQGTKGNPFRADVLIPEIRIKAKNNNYPQPFNNTLQNMQYRDLFYTKIPRALRFNDRISMMYSTELREPFLDYRLVEMAFSLPDNLKLNDNEGKWLLRKLVKSKLGENIAFAPKRALQTPQREWLQDDLKFWVEDRIKSLSLHPWFDKKVIRELWDDYKKGSNDNSFYLWQLINFSMCTDV